MFIELHFIQNFAPANLNRDDTGNPKDAEFGGVRRLRISSQALKRAIRLESVFAATTQVDSGVRTKHLAEKRLAPALVALGRPEDLSLSVATSVASVLGSGLESGDRARETKVLVYLTPREIDALAAQLHERWDEAIASTVTAPKTDDGSAKSKRPAKARKGGEEGGELFAALVKGLKKELKDRASAPDIALFGRMLADHPELNIDAACQVAHALSTHAIRGIDIDYFTAVDDLRDGDTAASAMIGTVAFGSACFYRYMRLNVDQLSANLAGDAALTRRSVEGFLRAAEAALPTGKQNSFAAHSRPSFMLAAVRTPHSPGWSLVNAFAKPIETGPRHHLIGESIRALDVSWQDLLGFYGTHTVKASAVALRADSGLTVSDLSEPLRAAHQPTLEAWIQTTLKGLE